MLHCSLLGRLVSEVPTSSLVSIHVRLIGDSTWIVSVSLSLFSLCDELVTCAPCETPTTLTPRPASSSLDPEHNKVGIENEWIYVVLWVSPSHLTPWALPYKKTILYSCYKEWTWAVCLNWVPISSVVFVMLSNAKSTLRKYSYLVLSCWNHKFDCILLSKTL